MNQIFVQETKESPISIVPIVEDAWDIEMEKLDTRDKTWLVSTGFKAKPGEYRIIPNDDGSIGWVAVGISSPLDLFDLAVLPVELPSGNYQISGDWSGEQRDQLSLGWGLGAYRFERYKRAEKSTAVLRLDDGQDLEKTQALVSATALVRDLINTPASDMMPQQLGAIFTSLAEEFGGQTKQVIGDDLLDQNYPAIHAVGRASDHAPRFLELAWGDNSHPKLTLVGKGICFDSGGLDIKPSSSMRIMKKDMGGAAQVIGLARLIMAQKLPVRLRLLVAAAENAIAGNSYRPGDVLDTRKGLTVEIENTDAEGRVVLSDALAEACADQPDLIIDFATLTGAARVALGTEIPVFFCNDDDVSSELVSAGERVQEIIWRLPLHQPYRDLLKSQVADITNCATSPFGGAITAALFLAEFVDTQVTWAHFDVMAWNNRTRPGRPEGGEAMGLRAVFNYLETRYLERGGA